MGNAAPNVNSTWLVFCYPGIDPDRISAILELPPTESKSGLVADATARTPLGLWKLALPPLDENETVEDQIARWLEVLESKTAAFAELAGLGFSPYLDCQAAAGALSLCVEPGLLSRLGALKIALSIWLYEKPADPKCRDGS